VDAERWGFLNRAVAPAQLDAAVGTFVEQLLKGAPGAIGVTKRMVRGTPGLPVDEAFAKMEELSARMFRGEEALEGMTAFAEKRPPAWAGGDR
jgi:enoyl-CoA hydratase/carnithine racemase